MQKRKPWFAFCRTAISQEREFKSRSLVRVHFLIRIIVSSDILTLRYAYFNLKFQGLSFSDKVMLQEKKRSK